MPIAGRAETIDKVSIAVTRYDEPDWLLIQALESIAQQQSIAAEVLVLDQQPSGQVETRSQELSAGDIHFKYLAIAPGALSRARNIAIEYAQTRKLLFLDTDAVAEDGWARFLAEGLDSAEVAVCGGKIVSHWHSPRPLLACARFVEEQYSCLDKGPGVERIAKIIGASFAIDLQKLGDQARFDEELGRRPGQLLGGEESDLCERAYRMGFQVLYDGRSIVQHHIMPTRANTRWILRRFYYGGLGRGLQGGTPASTHTLRFSDYLALPFVMPFYLAGLMRARLSSARVKYVS